MMNKNQFNPVPGFQQNQEADSENRDRNSRKEFPERTQQHDYKNPSANQIENDEEDEVDTDEGIFDQDDENNPDVGDKQSPGVSDREHN